MVGRVRKLIVVILAMTAPWVFAPGASARPGDDPFYVYHGETPLADYSPGTVLATRTVPYHVFNVPTPVTAIQVLYRTTNAQGLPAANVTSVLRPANARPDKVVSYQSAYDSLNPADSPSRAIAGDVSFFTQSPSGHNVMVGGSAASGEGGALAVMLGVGYTVVVADTEGPTADFLAGPEYGMATLDSLRAVRQVTETGIGLGSEFVMLGYSGGALATHWAAILAPRYAPEINDVLVGAAEGGLLVDPAAVFRYIDGTPMWSRIVPMAVVGLTRAYGIDIDPYLSDRGRDLLARSDDASILNVLAQYSDVRFADLMQPSYTDPSSIPGFDEAVGQLNMNRAALPTIPMFIAQASNGALEGTPPGLEGIGPGDGVAITGDVRALVHRYCEAGLGVQYDEYPMLSHFSAVPVWLSAAMKWIDDRLAGTSPPDNCAAIPTQ